MIDKLIGFSIRNKFIIGLFTVALIVWGVYSLRKLPIDALPDITNNQVQVITVAPTVAAQEVERFITAPIEITMANLPDITEIRSISRFGLSVITIVFEDKVDVYHARQLVNERLKLAEDQIPNGLGKPELAPVTTGLGEIYHYTLHAAKGYEKKYSAMELRTIQDWIVRRQLAGTPGIAEISAWGGQVKQYEVAIDPARLNSMNVTIPEVFEALEQSNENTGGAYIEKGSNAYFIRGIGQVTSLEDIQNIVVKRVNGIPVLISNVGEVQFGSAPRYGAITRNGEGEVVAGITLMLKGENSSEVIQNVKERIENVQKSLPEGVVIEPFIDRSELVDRAIHTVSKNLIEGGLIVIFILVLLLGNLRAGLVVASVIPLAMLFAIAMMNVFGVSGNLMSLGAIDFGLIVDGAVIIVESIVHRITSSRLTNGQTNLLSRQQMDEQVYEASVKIRQSAAFGEIIILIVYLPILTLVGIEGKMFKPMAQTVGFAILGALILSLTYVPMMSALFLSRKTEHKRNISDKIMDFFHRWYEPLILGALKYKKTVIISSVALFLISLLVFSRMGGEFIPTLEEGDLTVEFAMMQGTSLTQMVEATSKAEKILKEKFPEVKQVVSRIGAAEIPTDPMPIERADIMISMKEKDEWTSAESKEEMMEKMEAELSVLTGVNLEMTQPIQMRFNELMTGIRQDVAVKLYGEDMDILAREADEIAKIISTVEGVTEPTLEKVKGLPQITVKYDRRKMAQYGLKISEVNRVLKTAFAGEVAGVVFEGEKKFDMVVRLKKELRKDISDVSNLYIPLEAGTRIPLNQVADVQFQEGPAQVSRDDTKRRIFVGFNVRGRDVQSTVEEIQGKLESQLKLPPGYYITYGGQFENLIEAKERLSLAVPVALALIMLLLFFTFGSMKQAVLIFTAIPLSAIGGVFALWARGMPFSISAGIGFIALFGVAVLNGIVLIGYFNQLKKEGMTDILSRVLEGTKVRLRPVIMTAAVASLGFLPMALSNSAGAEVQKPLATVVIGGLISATLLTLLVLPVLYMLFSGKEEKKDGNATTASAPLMILLLIGGSFLIPSKALGQTNTPNARKITLDEAISEAVKNHPSMKAAGYEIEVQQKLKGTSFDLNKTNLGFEYGQINSINNDTKFTLSQGFEFPTVYTNKSALANANIKASEQQLNLTKAELIKNVKNAYYEFSSANAKRKLLLLQDSLFNDFAKAAELRYKVGESNYLEKTTAEMQLMEVRNQLVQAKADWLIAQKQLQILLNTQDEISIAEDAPAKRSFTLLLDSSAIAQNPYLSYLKQQLEISHYETKIERSKMLPDFSIGYFNQSINGIGFNANGTEQNFSSGNRFTGVQAGIAIPIWFKPHTSRIQAAKLNEKIAESNLQSQQLIMQGQLNTIAQEFQKYQSTIDYYEKSALPQAELIIQNANKAYKAGEIGYFEYLQSLNSGIKIKTDYLNYLMLYNQSIISIELITGGK
ncbi:MAG: CusA/CzcA family heavy metal efflux RND transporter [Bacteroidota bacterium]